MPNDSGPRKEASQVPRDSKSELFEMVSSRDPFFSGSNRDLQTFGDEVRSRRLESPGQPVFY